MGKQLSCRGNGVCSKKKHNVIVPILTVILFTVLIGISLFKLLYYVQVASDIIIAQEVQQLVKIFKRIDKTCKIIDFDYQKNNINFLNVKTFIGSEVGPMNLVHPDNWEGPYLKDNPTIQSKEYQVVKTKKGYFIVPGEGIRLSNGKVIGRDIILDENADIPKMMADKNFLNFKGKALAAPLDVGVSDMGKVILENIIRSDEGLVRYKRGCGVQLAMSK